MKERRHHSKKIKDIQLCRREKRDENRKKDSTHFFIRLHRWWKICIFKI
jgi:hypothetical protein